MCSCNFSATVAVICYTTEYIKCKKQMLNDNRREEKSKQMQAHTFLKHKAINWTDV